MILTFGTVVHFLPFYIVTLITIVKTAEHLITEQISVKKTILMTVSEITILDVSLMMGKRWKRYQ